MLRFLLNRRIKLAHEIPYSVERCNIDDSKDLEQAEELPSNFRLCKHCAKQKRLVNREIRESTGYDVK